MALIKSISGIRGTIGGKPGEGLSPADVVKFVSGYGTWLIRKNRQKRLSVVIGRDARISGEMISQLVKGTLTGLGIDITDLGLVSTPTVEIAVAEEGAGGGIIVTASHNPADWNALKLLDSNGEFVNEHDGQEILSIAESGSFTYASVHDLGRITTLDSYTARHIEKILQLSMVNRDRIANANFRVVVDGVNSVGGIAVPQLLRSLGVSDIIELHCRPDGNFPHDPEPLPENLGEISGMVRRKAADVGLAVDPDVDRLAIVNEDGSMFGEEYTLVAVADYVLQHRPGNTVSNLSSSRALRDVTASHGCTHFQSAVGEVHVVKKMKETGAVIGGEGNGGVILPELHYGRDALLAIALFLTHLAQKGISSSSLRKTYPDYHISKNKLHCPAGADITRVLMRVAKQYKNFPLDYTDGLKIDFGREWVHLRSSNTEPVIRIYAESPTREASDSLAGKIMRDLEPLLSSC